MKPRMKSVFSKAARTKMIKQLIKEHAAYQERFKKKGDAAAAPEYLITGSLNEHIENFLIVWGELEEIAVDQEKRWGKKATEVHDAMISKMLEYMVDENAKAYAMLFVVNPTATNGGDDE